MRILIDDDTMGVKYHKDWPKLIGLFWLQFLNFACFDPFSYSFFLCQASDVDIPVCLIVRDCHNSCPCHPHQCQQLVWVQDKSAGMFTIFPSLSLTSPQSKSPSTSPPSTSLLSSLTLNEDVNFLTSGLCGRGRRCSQWSRSCLKKWNFWGGGHTSSLLLFRVFVSKLFGSFKPFLQLEIFHTPYWSNPLPLSQKRKYITKLTLEYF